MKKPSWFRLVDLLTIGLGGIVSLGLLIYAAFSGVQGPHAKEGLCLTAVTGFCFIGIWLRFVLERKKWLDSYTWIPQYSLLVQFNDYTACSVGDLLELTERTIQAWSTYHPEARWIITRDILWVSFQKGLNEGKVPNITGRKVKGFVISGTRDVCVDYDGNEEAQRTAYEHELGHVIRGNATKQWNTAEHHAFAAAHGLK
jgi:hypothetical protein